MLWSLLKIVVFVVLVAALTVGAEFWMETGPSVLIQIDGVAEFSMRPLEAIVVLAVVLLGLWIAFKLVGLLIAFVRFLNGDDTAMSRYFDRNRERKGYNALGEAITALASGEGKVALTKAAQAERKLQKPELTALVTAQAAEMMGDKKRAEETYKLLLTNQKTRFVGIRGLMLQKLESGDDKTALALAEKAFELKPKHEGVQTTLLRLQSEAGEFGKARKTLGAALKAGNLPRDVYRRRDAVLAVSEAKGVLDSGNSIEARMEAIEANRLSPDLVPAATMAAVGYIDNGKPKLATRLLKKAWEVHPHPDLANAFAEVVKNEDPKQRVKRSEDLIAANPDHPESKMLKAELMLAAEDFPGARRALGDLASEAPTARSLSIMAAVERGTGADDSVVRGWLAKAVTAPRGAQWVCDNCSYVASDWQPTCPNCHAFDTLSWRDAPELETSSPPGAAMLPLLVGEPKADSAPVPAPVQAEPVKDVSPEDMVVEAEPAPADPRHS